MFEYTPIPSFLSRNPWPSASWNQAASQPATSQLLLVVPDVCRGARDYLQAGAIQLRLQGNNANSPIRHGEDLHKRIVDQATESVKPSVAQKRVLQLCHDTVRAITQRMYGETLDPCSGCNGLCFRPQQTKEELNYHRDKTKMTAPSAQVVQDVFRTPQTP